MAVDYAARARASRAWRRDRADVASFVRRIDWLLVGAVAALVGYGLWAIAGITRHDIAGSPDYYVIRQGVYVAIGFVGLVAVLFVDPERYQRAWRPILAGGVGVTVLVFLRGVESHGSKRWLDVGFFRFQPSEFGKALFVLALAGFLSERTKSLQERRTTLTAVGLAALLIGLVFLQPDVGTAMVYCAALAAVLFVAGTKWTHLAVLGARAALLAATVLWIAPAAGGHTLKPHPGEAVT